MKNIIFHNDPSGDGELEIIGKSAFAMFDEFNGWLAVKLGAVLSSMNFFWVCVVLDLIELPPVIAQHSVIVWCTYLSSVVFQLLALPVLGVLQKTGNDHHEKHSKKLDAIQDSLDKLHEKVTTQP